MLSWIYRSIFCCFRRLNAELEAKTAELVRQAEEVMVRKIHFTIHIYIYTYIYFYVCL